MKKALYILSGLGADERVFRKLDFSTFSVIHIKWIIPVKHETIEHYATRILAQIKTENPLIIGLSFGGIMATEIAKQIKTEKIILIASAKTKFEIPFYFRFLGALGFHKILPTSLLKSSNFITNWFFGTGNKVDKKLLKQILKDTDPTFLKWALAKVATWKNKIPANNVFHIHGDNDKILPLAFVKPNFIIENGGHLMTLNKADVLNKIIYKELNNI